MRQVGDRLIPVGIGRVHTEEGEGGEGGSGSRRRRNRNPPGELAQYLGMGGQDLEEVSQKAVAFIGSKASAGCEFADTTRS